MTTQKSDQFAVADQPAANLDQFLASVEQRAFQMARFAVHNSADALDLVQEAMLRLVTRYADKPPDQWRPLFFRILQRQITDWHRRQAMKQKLFFWSRDEHEPDTLQELACNTILPAELDLHQKRLAQRLPGLISRLPLRQQQCFLLRCWEGFDVKATAKAMGCSEGSVKTHYSRALTFLREALVAQATGE